MALVAGGLIGYLWHSRHSGAGRFFISFIAAGYPLAGLVILDSGAPWMWDPYTGSGVFLLAIWTGAFITFVWTMCSLLKRRK